jgi:transglutaminase-like putative cysteine protease
MLYDLKLKIAYDYDVAASGARHVVRVLPILIPGRQRLIAGSLSFVPTPDERADIVDFFGNTATSVLFRAAHPHSEVNMQARVQVDPPPPPQLGLYTRVSKLGDDLFSVWSIAGDSPHHFTGYSPKLHEIPEIAAYARGFYNDKADVAEVARAICADIYKTFKYDPEATDVDTSAREAFKLKAGVCQDFSHIMIAALRSLGIPAGYVSGYLRTMPPPGKERLEGADAMHAWVRVWAGRTAGWMEFDPTNNIPAGSDHIVVAYGRDYSDVAPIIGMLRGYGRHNNLQSVDVVPVETK